MSLACSLRILADCQIRRVQSDIRSDPRARSVTQGRDSSQASGSVATSPAAACRGPVAQSSSSVKMSSSVGEHTPSPPSARARPFAAHPRRSSPAPESDYDDDLSSGSGRSHSTKPAPSLAALPNVVVVPAQQDRGHFRDWLDAHITDIIVFNVGGMCWALIILATFVLWAASHS